jgi:hypothetical protein
MALEDRELTMTRRLLPFTLTVAAAAAALGSPPAAAQGKTYVVGGMGNHYTRIGREIRKSQPHKRVALVQLKNGRGFVLAREEFSWGTPLAVAELRRVMAAFDRQFPEAQPIILGDLSKKGGGFLDNHNSHADGRDVDIRLPLVPLADIAEKGPRKVQARYTWFLIREIVKTCNVEYIFVDKSVQRLVHEHVLSEEGVPREELELVLQYPRSEKKDVGIVRHWTNHEDHLHVRFRRASSSEAAASKAYCDWKKAHALAPAED